MSLSEIISKLEANESIKFSSTHQSTAIRVVIKKGDHAKNNKTVAFDVDISDLHGRSVDVIAFEVDRALRMLRDKSSEQYKRPPRHDGSVGYTSWKELAAGDDNA